MIQFSLKCTKGHRFESWFQSAQAYDALKASGMIACAVCGSGEVEKAVMAPRVTSGRSKAENPARPLSSAPTAAEQKLADIRRKIEENSDYVGMNFADEARAIHDGSAPERAIYGEARAEEAAALIKDGVPVTPLPFTPGRKTN